MEINQDDIFWVQIEEPNGSELGRPHPHVVIQGNIINRSRVGTVVVCALTSNIRQANDPGNVLLDDQIQQVSQVSALDNVAFDIALGDHLHLTQERVSHFGSALTSRTARIRMA